MSGSNSADQSWAQQDKRRMLVLDIRVQNVEHTQHFYDQYLGMKLWRRLGDLQQGQFTSICAYGEYMFSDSVCALNTCSYPRQCSSMKSSLYVEGRHAFSVIAWVCQQSVLQRFKASSKHLSVHAA